MQLLMVWHGVERSHQEINLSIQFQSGVEHLNGSVAKLFHSPNEPLVIRLVPVLRWVNARTNGHLPDRHHWAEAQHRKRFATHDGHRNLAAQCSKSEAASISTDGGRLHQVAARSERHVFGNVGLQDGELLVAKRFLNSLAARLLQWKDHAGEQAKVFLAP